MSSKDRFYNLEFRHRPVLKGDIGSMLRIEGLVVGGNGADAILLLPGILQHMTPSPPTVELTEAEWSDFIQRSDDPEILVGPAKIFQRKLRYAISGVVQQKVWTADGFKCMYCGIAMGKMLLTIDHYIPLELGGENDTSNYLSACRSCNKTKGSAEPEEFILRRKCLLGSHRDYLDYLASRVVN